MNRRFLNPETTDGLKASAYFRPSLVPERVWLTGAGLQPSNDVRACLGDVNVTAPIKINVQRAPPFWCDVDAPWRGLISPPIEHHKEIFVGQNMTGVTGGLTGHQVPSQD
ncbi:hypothetical protein JGS08_13630 [Pseudomonas cannabina pv. alisalensis]|nr:hypothetical protein JGS08_13630 [Pseudomonas cannabina pv. alisalensis]